MNIITIIFKCIMSEYSVNCHWVMTHCVWGPVSIFPSVCSSITQSGLSQCLVILSRISWSMFILAMTISVLLRICKISSWTLCCSGCWVIKQTVFSSSLWARATNLSRNWKSRNLTLSLIRNWISKNLSYWGE